MIIRRDDFGDVDKLTKGSQKKIWFICKGCGCGFLVQYNHYIRKKYGAYCRMCALHSKEHKKECSDRSRLYWKDDEYRNKVVKKASENAKGVKKSYNPRKEPYYYKFKEELESENYTLITSLEEYLRGDAYIKCLCPNGHTNNITYKEWTKQHTRCPVCKENERMGRVKRICNENSFKLIEIFSDGPIKKISFICSNGHKNIMSLSNFFGGTRCQKCYKQKIADKLPMKERYYHMVRQYTLKSIKEHSKLFNENDIITGGDNTIDHIYSIKQGFEDSILPQIIGSPINLQILSRSDNCKKNSCSWISKSDLFKGYEKFLEEDSNYPSLSA